jgi:hypothetical protein
MPERGDTGYSNRSWRTPMRDYDGSAETRLASFLAGRLV